MNPIGLAITAIAVGAYLIYRYWAPIKAFFMGLWAQVKTAFNGGLLGMGQLILNWSPLGLFYKAFAAVLRWFGVKLPADFTGFGAMLLNGLMRGITAKLSAAKAPLWALATASKTGLKARWASIHPAACWACGRRLKRRLTAACWAWAS